MLPAIAGSMATGLEIAGAQVMELGLREVAQSPGGLVQLAKRGYLDGVFALDLGGKQALTLDFGTLQERLKIPWVVWFVDDPEGYGLHNRCDPSWTIVLCWDRKIVEELRESSDFEPFHMPLGCDPRMLDLVERDFSREKTKRGIFVGSTCHYNAFLEQAVKGCPLTKKMAQEIWDIHKEDMSKPIADLAWEAASKRTGLTKRQLMEDSLGRLWVLASLYIAGRIKRAAVVCEVLERKGRVYGDPGWVEWAPNIAYGGPVEYGPKVIGLYLQSSFVLDIRQPQARTGLTQRVFDGSLCAKPVLTEYSDELEDLFEPDSEVVTFRSVYEARDKAQWLSKLPKEANLLAQRAKKRALAYHTYEKRAQTIINLLRMW